MAGAGLGSEGKRVNQRLGGRFGRTIRRAAVTFLRPDSPWQKVSSVFAGITIGTVVVWLTPAPDSRLAPAGLLVGGLVLGAVFRQWVGLAGLGLSLFLWMQAIETRFGVQGPMPAGNGLYLGVLVVVLTLLFSVLLAAGAYVVGLVLRRFTVRASGWLPLHWLAVSCGLISAVAICASTVSIAPADASFGFTLPAGWTSVLRVHSKYEWTDPIYCDSYSAGTGVGVLAGSGPAGFTVPTLCATVVEYNDDIVEPYVGYSGSHACYYVLADFDGDEGAMNQWNLESTPSAPPIAGSYEEVRVGPKGDVIYGFGLERWRSVGPFPEHLCYVVALTVPPGSSIGEAGADAILSTFSLR